MSRYPTNLTDEQWQVTENILDPQHRKRKYPLRDIMNAIMYILKTSCLWRMLPKDFPPHNTVFYYFNKWKLEGVFEERMGRKGHIVVDTLGLPMSVVVHEANVHDSVGADGVIDKMKGCFPRLKKMLADGGYKGRKLSDTVRQKLDAELTVVLRPDESSKKFSVLPLRWIVECSFSWLENFRRIAMDYEFYSDTGETMVQLAFCRLMYNKLCD